jgi:hypothetical protein
VSRIVSPYEMEFVGVRRGVGYGIGMGINEDCGSVAVSEEFRLDKLYIC